MFSLNINYIANKTNLSFNGHSWTQACRSSQIEMDEHWCVKLTANKWILRFQMFPVSIPTCFYIFLFPSWQFSFINCTMLKLEVCCSEETSSPLALWLRSIGFHSALCSPCTTAVQRESIKTSHVQCTTPSPYPHWFHTHGSTVPVKCSSVPAC